MKTGKIRHILSDWECSSRFIDRNCDICGKFCNDVYGLIEEKEYVIPARKGGEEHRGWTQHECRNRVGHKECLLKYSNEIGAEIILWSDLLLKEKKL